MSSESEHDRSSGSIWLLILLALMVLFGMGVGGIVLWRRYDPFIMDRPSVKESKSLADIARQRPLTEEEFEAAIRVLRSDTTIAQLSALAVIEVEARRSPERKTRAIEAMTDAVPNADAAVRPSLERVLSRVKGK